MDSIKSLPGEQAQLRTLSSSNRTRNFRRLRSTRAEPKTTLILRLFQHVSDLIAHDRVIVCSALTF